MVNIPYAFASPVLPLMFELASAGVRFRRDGNQVLISPPGALTTAQREAFRRHQEEVRTLVSVLVDRDLQDRLGTFRSQWERARPPAAPAFLFLASLPYVKGKCFSCAEVLPEFRFGRCWRCSLAWRLVCGLPVPEDLAATIEAKVLS